MFWDYFSLNWMRLSPLLPGWILDRFLGDPEKLWHPVVTIGKIIAFGEKHLNRGAGRFLKGGLFAIILILSVYFIITFTLQAAGKFNIYLKYAITCIGVFYCLAGKTLEKEVKGVFTAVSESTEKGRKQLARIVGRDTSELTPGEIRTAALETLSENLSDGVIAPMLWFTILGLPGMIAYKVINTLDSMIGYRNERYEQFGKIAAKLDDIANYIPARLTAYLMLLVSRNRKKLHFVNHFGKCHTSPNSGYPEAALAGILDCRFGGPHSYFGKVVEKPYIGTNERSLDNQDLEIALRVCTNTEIVAGIGLTLYYYYFI